MRDWHGRVAVVTGASAGVGRATVRELAARGADVGILARGQEGLDGARREAEAAGARAVAIRVDVADAEQVESAAAQVERELGPIDVWINNAMTSVFTPFAQITAEEFRRTTEVTYLGTVHGTMAAIRRMLPRDSGSIVQVGSALAYRGIPLQSAYCGAKHAIQGFTESLRCELLHDGSNVRIAMVQLPALNTPQFEVVRTRLPRRPQPVAPIYQPEVAAEAILSAADGTRREWWTGGSTVKVLLGNKLAAGFADRYLASTGYDAQQAKEPVNGDRPDNLFEPVPGDHGAHGRFDDQARQRSLQLEANKHRTALLIAGAAASAVVAARALRG
jgi:NAD(P)-dependent dehydrogenase (short-subunit alcohol dehydrogenase family)